MEEDMGFIEQFFYDSFGIDVPDYVFWIVVGIIVVIALAFVLKGFFKELRK